MNVMKPPQPVAAPSSRASRAGRAFAIRPSVFPSSPYTRRRLLAHASAAGACHSLAARAISSGARTGSARKRSNNPGGGSFVPSSKSASASLMYARQSRRTGLTFCQRLCVTGYRVPVQAIFEHRLELTAHTTRALELDGDGPGIVLLHGWGDSADTWRPLLVELAARGRRAIAVDLPGFGEATRLGKGSLL